jgi:predicted phage terminase large subunit-like protein
MPPRHGKTRTLIYFCAWLIGLDPKIAIMVASYNEMTATDFSKYVRDTIREERINPAQIIYEDIFPNSQIKKSETAKGQWTVEGSFFTYKGVGIGGSATGKGAKVLIVDDPIKSAEEAFNKNHLEKLWIWYTGTWMSRQEADGIQIICHTPWVHDDIGGKIQREEMKDDFYLFRRPAKTEKGMLCEEILSDKKYEKYKRDMLPLIFKANYELMRIDEEGLLYGAVWKTYTQVPMDEKGKEIYTQKMVVMDTADKGTDYLCEIYSNVYNGYCYVTDIYYTDADVQITWDETVKRIISNKPNICHIEANAGGHNFSQAIQKILKGKKYRSTIFKEFTQRTNKEARIYSKSAEVKERIIMPIDWMHKWPKFYKDVVAFMKQGKNKHDDCADGLTLCVEHMDRSKIKPSLISAGSLGL